MIARRTRPLWFASVMACPSQAVRSPGVMFQPWLAHWFPGVTIEQLEQGYWSMELYVGMVDYARESISARD